MSTDGKTWTRSSATPILDIGATSAFDENGLGELSVYYSSPYYYMLYTGRNMSEERNIGLAVSANGIDWVKLSLDGEFNQTESWNSAVICDTTFLNVGDEVLVYYGGGDMPEPAQGLNGEIGVFTVDLSQNRDMSNWNVNANWAESLVSSENVLQGSYPIEESICWCKGKTSIELVNDQSKSNIFIQGWIPVESIHSLNDKSEVTISVYVNDELKMENIYSSDDMFEFEISKDIESDIISIRIEANSELILSECSDNTDERTLSYTLNCIEQK